jgi:autotransporter-associated beta strand protein
MLWNARYSDNANPESIPVQTGSPKTTYTTLSLFYGPWDDYGNTDPWSFWQYASTVSIPGFNAVDATVDGNVSHGDIEYIRNYLAPAVWWHNSSGDWSTLANWNSGQAPVVPVTPADQATPYSTGSLPIARLPGAAGTGPTSGQYDTVILERPNANIVVTLSSGTHNIRKLYMRETLNLNGGSLTINYNPAYRADNSADVRHAGPISAQFSGPVTLGNTASLSVHTLQVDAGQVFTLSGGTLICNTIHLMPAALSPARMLISGDLTLNPLANATAVVRNGAGTGNSGFIDLAAGVRTLNVGNGANEIDLSLDTPVVNGGLAKTGAGTLRVTSPSTYAGGTIVSAGKLLVNNSSGSGTGTGSVTVNGGTLGGTGTIAGPVTVNTGGTISLGMSIGTLTFNSAPALNGTTVMEIDRNAGAPLADKIILTTGTLNFGGTLMVTNLGAPLLGGEVFNLFAAPAYSGAFSTSNLPPLSAGLNWHLGQLASNGTMKVNRKPSAAPLTFTNIAPAVLEIPFALLTASATDPDGDSLSLANISLTTSSGVPLATNSDSISYSNIANSTDQFTYTLSDGHGAVASGTVNIVNIGSTPSAQFVGTPVPTGSSVLLHFSATPGWTYYLERSTDLATWTRISTIVAPANGVLDYTDNFPDLGSPPASAFYRLGWDQ